MQLLAVVSEKVGDYMKLTPNPRMNTGAEQWRTIVKVCEKLQARGFGNVSADIGPYFHCRWNSLVTALTTPMLVSQRIVQVCLFLVAAAAVLGGTLQMYLGQPDTSPRLDNVHRFMAGVYLATGIIISGQPGPSDSKERSLLSACFSLASAGLSRAQWLAYLISELLVAVVIAVAHKVTRRAVS